MQLISVNYTFRSNHRHHHYRFSYMYALYADADRRRQFAIPNMPLHSAQFISLFVLAARCNKIRCFQYLVCSSCCCWYSSSSSASSRAQPVSFTDTQCSHSDSCMKQNEFRLGWGWVDSTRPRQLYSISTDTKIPQHMSTRHERNRNSLMEEIVHAGKTFIKNDLLNIEIEHFIVLNVPWYRSNQNFD